MKTFKELTKNDFQNIIELKHYIEKREENPDLPVPDWAEIFSSNNRFEHWDLVNCIRFGCDGGELISAGQAYMYAERLHITFHGKPRYANKNAYEAAESRRNRRN